jgi:hypothetical protein
MLSARNKTAKGSVLRQIIPISILVTEDQYRCNYSPKEQYSSHLLLIECCHQDGGTATRGRTTWSLDVITGSSSLFYDPRAVMANRGRRLPKINAQSQVHSYKYRVFLRSMAAYFYCSHCFRVGPDHVQFGHVFKNVINFESIPVWSAPTRQRRLFITFTK